jgi:uncharacterized Zn-binding protein involved in type VI secretion
MGQPAARLGDPTAHGGTITAGCPTVLIGGMPAARVGDMHTCPMVTPGTPPVPHVGGPISKGSTGVFIGGVPAARMGDMAVCVGPPSSILMGCPTVLIGEGGGGAGSSGSANGALTSANIAGKGSQNQLSSHFLDVTFEDGAKLPISGIQYKLTDPNNNIQSGFLTGRIKRTGVPEGDYKITLRGIVNAQWSEKQADVGTQVTLNVKTIGVENSEKVSLEIFIRDSNYTDYLLEKLETQVNDNAVQAQWTLKVDEKYLNVCNSKESDNKRYSRPFFFFRAKIAELSERSGLLYYKDWIELKAIGKDGKPAANEEYILRLKTGEIRKGKLDGNGYKKIENVSPSMCEVEFPNLPEVSLQ